jgi:hypothetical protein
MATDEMGRAAPKGLSEVSYDTELGGRLSDSDRTWSRASDCNPKKMILGLALMAASGVTPSAGIQIEGSSSQAVAVVLLYCFKKGS